MFFFVSGVCMNVGGAVADVVRVIVGSGVADIRGVVVVVVVVVVPVVLVVVWCSCWWWWWWCWCDCC
eukprot:NODE_390_length_1412_cov_58.923698_g288_i0.p5 GENE.NODE_390_length_1412_cov_58.923698_g288_i0~~NODE_390_length_1412_cov_58.923698_g288_i0.p5  ORF type:complete len:67 (+),score=16.43 NODE_390_length_1412_cov_58.923698_g288_i0:610-810(+)